MPSVLMTHTPPVEIPATPEARALVMASISLQATLEYLEVAGARDLVSEALRLKQAIVRHPAIREGRTNG